MLVVKAIERHIQIEVVIPDRYYTEFRRQFCAAFVVEGDDINTGGIIDYDGGYEHDDGGHAIISVPKYKVSLFYSFLQDFCQQREMSFLRP